MSILHYMRGVAPSDLQIGQCVILRDSSGTSWRLHLCVPDATAGGKPNRSQIPINPNGDAYRDGFWGLKLLGNHEWQVIPSIHIWMELPDPTDPAKSIKRDVWHETPKLVNVPDDEPWTIGG